MDNLATEIYADLVGELKEAEKTIQEIRQQAAQIVQDCESWQSRIDDFLNLTSKD